jgi:hypothetical protein
MEKLKSLCSFNDLKDKSNVNLWVVGSKNNTNVLVFNGNKTDSQVKKAYTKEILGVNYFDVRLMRLKSFLKRNPTWS